jgi:hypothetical protein
MSLVLTFASIHDALAAEKAASGLAFDGGRPELIPLPAAVKSDCGFGLAIGGAQDLEEGPVAALLGRGLMIEAIYRLTGKEKSYERIDQED